MIQNRRKFLKKSAGLIAGAGVVSGFISKYATGFAKASTEKAASTEQPLGGEQLGRANARPPDRAPPPSFRAA